MSTLLQRIKAWKPEGIFIVLMVLFIIHSALVIFTENAHGGADMIGHYFISRYSFAHPFLFFDHWGKPFYTLLASPFAALGFPAARLFSVLCGLASVYFVFRILKAWNIRIHWSAYFIFAFAPMFFHLMQATLTEALMGLMLVASVYALQQHKHYIAALMMSFVPFVRTEGIILFPVVAVLLLYRRKYTSILFLSAGTLLYSFAGYFIHHDWLWVIHKMPYSVGSSMYGSGELIHFIKNHNIITGWPLSLLLFSGTVLWIREWKMNKFRINEKIAVYILISAFWMIYFVAHSLVWWLGMGGSLGLLRVMASIIPLMAIPSLWAIHYLFQNFLKKSLFQFSLILLFVFYQAGNYYHKLFKELHYGPREKLIREVAAYIGTTHFSRLIYFDPLLIYFLDLDPYQSDKVQQGVSDRIQPSNSLKEGDVVVWDSHLGLNEYQLPLSHLVSDSLLERVGAYCPSVPLKTFKGDPYEFHVFRMKANLMLRGSERVVTKRYDFHAMKGLNLNDRNGRICLKISENDEYSPTLQFAAGTLCRRDSVKIVFRTAILTEETVGPETFLMAASFEAEGRPVYYQSQSIIVGTGEMNQWHIPTFTFHINQMLPPSTTCKFYIWNKEKRTLCLEWMEATMEVSGECSPPLP